MRPRWTYRWWWRSVWRYHVLRRPRPTYMIDWDEVAKVVSEHWNPHFYVGLKEKTPFSLVDWNEPKENR